MAAMVEGVARMEESSGSDLEALRADIAARNRPLVIRGLVDAWPLVARGRQSPQAMVEYLTHFYQGSPVNTVTAPPGAGGRLFYQEGARALNFNLSVEKLSNVLKGLL